MKMARDAWKRAIWAVVVIAGTSCGGATNPTEGGIRSQDSSSSGGGTQPSLVACPTNTTVQASGTIGLLGGLLSAGGTTVEIPAGALLTPTNMVLTIPASPYMEIDVSVPGVQHFVFEKAILVTIDYSRCERSNIDRAPLQVWHIDTTTKALLEQMTSVDSKLTRTILFTTGHLSGYALAN